MPKFKRVERVATPYSEAELATALAQLRQSMQYTIQQYGGPDSNIRDYMIVSGIDEQGPYIMATVNIDGIASIGN